MVCKIQAGARLPEQETGGREQETVERGTHRRQGRQERHGIQERQETA